MPQKHTKDTLLFLFFGIQLLVFLGLSLYLWGVSAGKIPVAFCPFLHLFHLYCPGCGGSRAALALLMGNIVGSFLANPTVLFIAGALVYYEIALLRFFLGKIPAKKISLLPLYLVLGVFVLHFLLRNFLFLAFDVDYLGNLRFLRG